MICKYIEQKRIKVADGMFANELTENGKIFLDFIGGGGVVAKSRPTLQPHRL